MTYTNNAFGGGFVRPQFKRVKVFKKKVQVLSAFSAKEALDILTQHPDTSLMLVDIVMESDRAGLELINIVRNQLNNKRVRIIVRSGYIELVREHVKNDFAKKYDVSSIADKVEISSSIIELVKIEIKKYKVSKGFFTLIKLFVVKVVVDWIKKVLT